MGKFSCNCLNVKIHTKGEDFTPKDVSELGIHPPLHEFFSQKLIEGRLNIEGIIKEFSLLTRTFQLSDGWRVCRCVNCKVWTHANQDSSNTLLINANLTNSQTDIEKLKESSEYSLLYKILVPARNETYVKDMVAIDSTEYSHVETSLERLQYSCDKYVKEEDAGMKKRIREFEEREREHFNEIEGKARRDKTTILAMILVTQQEISDDLNHSKQAKAQTPPSPPLSSFVPDLPPSPLTSSPAPVVAKAVPRNTPTTAGFAGTTGVRTPSSRVVSSLTTKATSPLKPRSALSSMLDDGTSSHIEGSTGHMTRRTTAAKTRRDMGDDMELMFGQDTGDSDKPFYCSDDDDELGDTDDSEPEIRGSSSSGGGQVGNNRKPTSVYSSSVPIGINPGNWGKSTTEVARTFRDHDIGEDEELLDGPVPPEDMAASMKKLARSVHADTTEMFGDLPRSRFKTTFSRKY